MIWVGLYVYVKARQADITDRVIASISYICVVLLAVTTYTFTLTDQFISYTCETSIQALLLELFKRLFEIVIKALILSDVYGWAQIYKYFLYFVHPIDITEKSYFTGLCFW